MKKLLLILPMLLLLGVGCQTQKIQTVSHITSTFADDQYVSFGGTTKKTRIIFTKAAVYCGRISTSTLIGKFKSGDLLALADILKKLVTGDLKNPEGIPEYRFIMNFDNCSP